MWQALARLLFVEGSVLELDQLRRGASMTLKWGNFLLFSQSPSFMFVKGCHRLLDDVVQVRLHNLKLILLE